MARTYGRISNPDGSKSWEVVQTSASGQNDLVWVTTLCQVLLLNLGESPFYANYGIPAKPSVVQQLFPDFYVSRTQQQFSQYFANLIIVKQPSTTPKYSVNVITNTGVKIVGQVAV